MANDVAMRWRNRSSARINATLQLLVIYLLIDYYYLIDQIFWSVEQLSVEEIFVYKQFAIFQCNKIHFNIFLTRAIEHTIAYFNFKEVK